MGQRNTLRLWLVLIVAVCAFMMLRPAQPTAFTYFISPDGNDGNIGTSQGQPWKTLAKLNSVTLGPSDQVLLQRNKTFVGPLPINQSGNAGSQIVFGAYGTGTDPKVSGFISLNTWTNTGGNIWSADLNAGSAETMVTADGVILPPGRFPNTGWLNITSGGMSSMTTSATGISGFASGEAKANVVTKKREWIINKEPITSISGSTINFTPVTGYPSLANFGFIFTDHLTTLDRQNEWYYSASQQKLFFYSVGNPSSRNIKAATIPTILSVSNKNYIRFQNISFEGSTANLVEVSGGNGNEFVSCDFRYAGQRGFWGPYMNNFVMYACNVQYTNYAGVDAFLGTNQKFILNTISYNAMNVELCGPNDAANHGLWVNGDGSLIERNHISFTGYNGTYLAGNYDTLQNNYIHNFCQIATDGAGVYMGSEPNKVGRIIRNNIILYGKGPKEGTPQSGFGNAHGIYPDEGSGGFFISNNLLAYNSGSGLFFHRAWNGTASGNTLAFNENAQLRAEEDEDSNPQKIQDIIFTGNFLLAGSATQNIYRLKGSPSINNFFSSMSNNMLSKPSTPNSWVYVIISEITYTDYTLAGFKSAYPSYNIPNLSPPAEFNAGSPQIFTNPTAGVVSLPLDGLYKKIDGTNFNSGSMSLAPYGYAVTKRTGNLPSAGNNTVNFKGRIIISNGP